MLIDKKGKEISIRLQCKLLGINRSNIYYRYKAAGLEKRDKLRKIIDVEYLKDPCGVTKMLNYLNRKGYKVGEKLIRNLMRGMNLSAIYPKKKLSKRHPEHKIYPYLLKGLKIIRANQVWCTDITYIPLVRGYCYLTAIMDWFSRYIIAWRISNTLEAEFCVDCLKESLDKTKPEIFNSDQGSQFTSNDFTETLLEKKVKISMDGRGRVFDNIFIERLWRTVKYSNVYVQDYQTITDVREGLKKFFTFYNRERIHQSLDYQTPWEVYSGIKFKPKSVKNFSP